MAWFDRCLEYLLSGGPVLILLIVLLLVQWFCIAERFFLTRNLLTQQSENLLAEGLTPKILFSYLRNPLLTTVKLAPLVGLFGTVVGMIETFDFMASAQTAQASSLSDGISKALITTQMGLVVAVPGIFIAKLLDRRLLFVFKSMGVSYEP
ncbi:MotA/TolQ/ExbB proton channel family protein [bacterium]|nr:MotA/TolQ/ExbB proton channel family protein [bacterium]